MDRVRGFEVVSRMEGKDVKLPERSTKGSAGYDFYACEDVVIPPAVQTKSDMFVRVSGGNNMPVMSFEPVLIKTGVKAYMPEDEVLYIYNRSSNPKKNHMVIPNGVGIIDSDYYNNEDNEGEIGFIFYNMTSVPIQIKKGSKLGQGIFGKYLLADNDTADGERTGGFGSTGK